MNFFLLVIIEVTILFSLIFLLKVAIEIKALLKETNRLLKDNAPEDSISE